MGRVHLGVGGSGIDRRPDPALGCPQMMLEKADWRPQGQHRTNRFSRRRPRSWFLEVSRLSARPPLLSSNVRRRGTPMPNLGRLLARMMWWQRLAEYPVAAMILAVAALTGLSLAPSRGGQL